MPLYSAWYNVKTWTMGYNYLKDPMMKYVSLTQIFRNSVHSGHLPLGVPQQTVRKVSRFPVTEHNDHRAPMQNVYTRNRALFTKAQWNLPSASSKQLCSAAVHLYVIAKWCGAKPCSGKALVHHRSAQTKRWISKPMRECQLWDFVSHAK